MIRKFSPQTIYAPIGQYHNAVEVGPGGRIVFSSGLIGARGDGSIPQDPAEQIDLAWANVAGFLAGCAMTVENLVRMKMHLVSRDLLPLSREARIRHLGEHMHCAVTGVVVDLFDPDLVIEIDVTAAA